MGPAFRLFRVAGIDVRMHWTFLLLLAWFFATPLLAGGPDALAAGLRSVVFVLGVFACVVLHEFGHAFAARAFGIRTRDVTLLPIGGVARLERMPEKPAQELVVALAGPAVNVVIAAISIVAVALTAGPQAMLDPPEQNIRAGAFLPSLAFVNVFLAVFNLIPAFPMDGGRVLRALLAMAMGRIRATRIAAAVGQLLAVAFAIFGLFVGNVLLMLVALFVFLGAGAEAQATEASAALRGVSVRQAMVRRFRVLRESDTLNAAAQELLSGSQQDFPVLRDGADQGDADALVGILTRSRLIRALASGGLSTPVRDAMETPCAPVSPEDPIQRALDRAGHRAEAVGSGAPCPPMPVIERGADGRRRLVGMITSDNVAELVAIRAALAGASDGS